MYLFSHGVPKVIHNDSFFGCMITPATVFAEEVGPILAVGQGCLHMENG